MGLKLKGFTETVSVFKLIQDLLAPSKIKDCALTLLIIEEESSKSIGFWNRKGNKMRLKALI